MKIRLYDKSDYPEICRWWERRKAGFRLAECLLPEVGFVVEDKSGKPLACAWLFEERSGIVAWLAYTVSNPDNNPFISARALITLTEGAEAYCKKTHGIMFVECETDSGLNKIYSSQGFIAGEQKMNQYFKILR